MAQETEYAREVRAELAKMYPGKRMLTKSEVCAFTGLNYRTVVKRFPFVDGYISVIKLCNMMG